jgi:hypothetical protein
MALVLDEPALKRMFPKASRSFIEANASRVPDAKSKPDAPSSLDSGAPGKTKSSERTLVRITRYACRSLDQDNLIGGCKACADCLKESGLIEDDSPEAIDLVVTQEKVFNKDHERTEIEIIWPGNG